MDTPATQPAPVPRHPCAQVCVVARSLSGAGRGCPLATAPPPITPAQCDAHAVAHDVHEQLLAAFIEAATVTLRECAGVELVPRLWYLKAVRGMIGDMAAYLRFTPGADAALALGCTEATATALARRVLAEVEAEPGPDLVRDCLGELVNVIAGQAKALLHGTHRITLSTPVVITDGGDAGAGRDCLVIAFGSEAGDLALQVFLPLPTLPVLREG